MLEQRVELYVCLNCTQVVDQRGALKGKQFGRPGELVHAKLHPDGIKRLCGVVKKMEA